MSIYTKLLEIQAMHLAFEKDANNPFFKSKYVSLDSIVEKLTPILDEKKLVVYHFTDNKEIVTNLIDTEKETDFIQSRFPLIDSNDPQKLGSCITYAKRYNLSQIFNIITDRDDDGNEASGVEKKAEKPKTTATYSGEKKEYPKTEADDLLDEMGKEKDINNLKILFAKLYPLGKTDKQKAFYKSKYEQEKNRIEN